MSEIPEDIWKDADKASARYWFGDHLSGRLKSIIAKALMEERERCAQIVDDMPAHADWANYQHIAAAIRSPAFKDTKNAE